MVRIADTGLIVALLSRRDRYYPWTLEQFRRFAPFHICDAVLGEAAGFFPDPLIVLHLIERGDLILDDSFNLAAELPYITALVKKYADHPMDLADARVVRMSEIHRRCKVWTVDRTDFQSYRRYEREPIPCAFPP